MNEQAGAVSVRSELARAIEDIRGVPVDKGTITVINTFPKWNYKYTCPKCHCHTAYRFPFPADMDSRPARVCANCRLVYSVATRT